ncbi:MAG: hypothetical protein ABIR06_10825 [Cyclobacteriaceae bacterium]
MKLVDKFSVWFVVITSLVLMGGGLIVFRSVQHEIDQEAIRRIKSNLDNIAQQLKEGKKPETLASDHVEIKEKLTGPPRSST